MKEVSFVTPYIMFYYFWISSTKKYVKTLEDNCYSWLAKCRASLVKSLLAMCDDLEWMVTEGICVEVPLKLNPKAWEAANYTKSKERAFQQKGI